MSVDYRVNGRSDYEVGRIARRARSAYQQDGRCPVDVIRCLESGWVRTEFGRKKLELKVVPDSEMPNDDARTEYIDGVVVVMVRRSVYLLAKCGDGRSRMTLAHELGHAVMHPGAPKHRHVGAAGTIDLSRVKPYESAEHQAKVFASAFLINDDLAINFDSADRISEEFGVSFEAAAIYCEQRVKRTEREESARRVRELNAQLQASIPILPREARYAPDACTVCGKATMVPIGTKYWCDTCRKLRDPFADGDRLAEL